jgi:fibronectin-binding autotransporter adhesin
MSYGFLSNRVKRRDQSGITSDRYEFLGLDQAEPDLGDPLIGPSSVTANPFTGDVSNLYFVASDGSGSRYWTKQTDVVAGGVITPGSITVRDEGVVVGSVNQVTDINFVGSGVTITSPASWVGAGSSSVDIQISVTDVTGAGNVGNIQYKGPTGFTQGSDDLFYNSSTQRLGLGTAIPTQKLDVKGNVLVSGIITANSIVANSFTVDNFRVNDEVLQFIVTADAVGIGTTQPIATLDVRGTANISGATTTSSLTATTSDIGISTATRISAGFITATNAFIGVLTGTSFYPTNIFSTSINGTTITANSGIVTNLSVSAGATITGNLQVDGNTLYVNSVTNNVGFGTTNPLQRVQSGASTNPVVITDTSNIGVGTLNPAQRVQVGVSTNSVVITDTAKIGIGTTNPNYNLDITGDVAFTGKLYASGSSGSSGQVLLSGGTGSPTWGAPGAVTVGAAVSVSIASTQASAIFYPTFTQQTQDNALLRVDSSGLSFNPALNYFGIGTTDLNSTLTVNGTLGIGTNNLYTNPSSNSVGIGTTNPTSNLDVRGNISASTTVSAGTTVIIGPSNLSSGIVTTTATTANQVLNSFNTSLYRSAKYNVQVTCTGQLVGSASSGSSVSVSSLQGGTNYVSGNYTNVSLTTSSGTGNDARANITVTAEKRLNIDSISSGLFNTSDDTTLVNVNAPVVFDRAIPATAAQNSKVTSITVTNVGSGYTAIPTIGIATPTNNPAIAGVTGIGSTATAVVSSMIVANVAINTAGIHTSVPTITFISPVGGGTSATGVVGFGLSTVSVTNSGSGYNPLPTVSVSGATLGISTVAISSVFATNLYVTNTGLGFTSGNFPTIAFSAPSVGINTARAVVNSLGISTHFTVVPGIGYTRPPILTVTSPSVGVNTATLTCTLGVSTFTVVNPGSAYTSSPSLSLSPTVTGFAATVGLGVSSANILVNGGSSYGSAPTVTFSAPNVGFNTATGTFGSLAGGVLGNFVITNPGSGYFTIPTVNISGGGGTGAAVTITQMVVTDVTINNAGFGVSVVPTAQIISTVGSGASVTPSMGIGKVDVVGFGSGYNSVPGVAVTAINGLTGSGASVTAGLGVTSSNITITNAGSGYTSIPSITISSPTSVSIAATGIVGVGITAITVSNPGIGYSVNFPSISFNTGAENSGSGASATVRSVVVTNVYITNPGSGYTATDLAIRPIATFNPVGTSATVGFGVSTITLTNLGIGYTTAASAVVTISNANLGIGSTATASASLGYPGILPGPGVTTTGNTAIYYVASKTSNSIGISTGVGIGTLTSVNVGDDVFSSNKPVASIGGIVAAVSIVSPGSGYTSTSRLGATNFDGANVGTGFTFTSSVVVNNYQFSDVMLLQSVGSASTSCDYIEFGTIANNEILGSFSGDISGTSARLLFTPTYRNNTIKLSSNFISS